MNYKLLLASALILPTAVHLSGCAAAGGTTPLASNEVSVPSITCTDELRDANACFGDLQSAQNRVAELERELSERAPQIAENTSNTVASGMFPPNPEPGQCYARILTPARFNTTSETVLVREPSERITIVPAVYETAQERVLVKEASTGLEIIPAVYTETAEQILVAPASERLIEFPAEFNTVSENILDEPAHTMWKRGPAAIQSGNVLTQQITDTGEIMCLVEVPATYRTITRQELVRPARTESVPVPAEYEMVMRQVLSQPATTREIVVPAEYAFREVRKLVRPATQQTAAIPAEYETVTRNEKVSDESLEWRSVMCEVNMTRENIMALQTALQTEGLYTGAIDGRIGPMTFSAASRFATEHGLPSGSNYITLDVIDALGLGERTAALD